MAKKLNTTTTTPESEENADFINSNYGNQYRFLGMAFRFGGFDAVKNLLILKKSGDYKSQPEFHMQTYEEVAKIYGYDISRLSSQSIMKIKRINELAEEMNTLAKNPQEMDEDNFRKIYDELDSIVCGTSNLPGKIAKSIPINTTEENKKTKETKSDLVKSLESEETQTLPNIIICRKYAEDKQNDMQALQSQFPEILENVTYLSNPGEVTKHLKSDRKNIIFVGQYFDHNMTGTQVASAVKEKGLDSQVALITSISVPPSQRLDCDYFYQISQAMNQSDGANIIVQHLQKSIKKPNNQEEALKKISE